MITESAIQSSFEIKHQEASDWINEVAQLCKPDQIQWCDGSKEEYDGLCQKLVDKGTFIRLNP